MTPAFDRPLLVGAIAHGVLAVVLVGWLIVPAEPIMGVHPALKPWKFAVSVGVFLATMAVLLPLLQLEGSSQRVLSAVLLVTMVLETVPIVVQALRGTTSHFNQDGLFNTALWRVMQGSIGVATVVLVVIAWLLITRPLAVDGFFAFAWRAGLVVSLFGAVSGFAMGGSGAHSVGGVDGGPGLPLVNWSTRHGDLRVAHFVALHAAQSVPLGALVLSRLMAEGPARWLVLVGFVLAHAGVAVATFVRAVGGKTPW